MENNRAMTINFPSFTFLIEKVFIAQSNLTYTYIIYVDQSTKSDQRTDLNAVRINLDRFSSFIEQDFRNKISVSFDPVWFDPHDRPAPIRLRAICQWQRNRFPSRKSSDDNRTRAAVHIFPSFVSSLGHRCPRNFLLGGNSTWMENPDTTRVSKTRLRLFCRVCFSSRMDGKIETRELSIFNRLLEKWGERENVEEWNTIFAG